MAVFLFASDVGALGAAEIQDVLFAEPARRGEVPPRQQNSTKGKKPRRSDSLALTLSLTLSTPKELPAASSTSTKTNEAAKKTEEAREAVDAKKAEAVRKAEEAIREQKLKALNAQIAELKQVVKSQLSQLSIPASPTDLNIATSGVLAQSSAVGSAVSSVAGVSSVPVVGNEQPPQKIVAPDRRPASREEKDPVESLEMNWINPAIGLLLVLLAVSGFVWYRRYEAAQQWKRGTFHDLSDVNDPEWVEPVIVQTPMPVNAQAIKISANEEEQLQSILPPDYEMLEEVDIYLRFGHDKLAEELLREAFKINPKNPQTHLKLLRIYFAREDRVAFQEVAQHMKSLTDGVAWAEATEMGRSLDPDNALYQ